MAGKSLTATEIANLVAGRLVGQTSVAVSGVESLSQASEADVSFLGNTRYTDQVLPSQAAVVLVPEDFDLAPPAGRAWVVCPDASDAFTKLVEHFAPPPPPAPVGIHPSAVVGAGATVADSAGIGANAVIEDGAVIGSRSVVGAGCYVGHGVCIGEDCLLHPNVTVRERCRLGHRVIIHSGTVIGSDGFGYIPGADGHTKIPQVGIVQIDDDVEIGAQVAIDRARFGKTWVKQGAKIDNLVQIAHNVVIGEHSFIIAQVGISGSTELGRGVIAAGQVGLAGHLRIGDGVTLMAKAGVAKDIPAGQTVIGSPAVPRKEFARNLFAVNSIGKLKASVKKLQQEVAELKGE
jgi:UDP-3-O-[3-hydroxymyristoyl] glucosamine N-acyltransferase